MGADKPCALELLASECKPHGRDIHVSNIALLLQGTKSANVVQYLDADVAARHTALGIGASPAELALAVFRNRELREVGIETFLYTIDSDTHHVVAVSKVGNEKYVVHDHGYHRFDDAMLLTSDRHLPDSYISMLGESTKNAVTLVDVRRNGSMIKVERYQPRHMVIEYPESYSFNLDEFQWEERQVKDALVDSANFPNDSVYLRKYVPKQGDEAAYFIECSVKHGSTNGYKVRKIENSSESPVDIKDFDHFCELFGITTAGRSLLLEANQVAMNNGGYNLQSLWQ